MFGANGGRQDDEFCWLPSASCAGPPGEVRWRGEKGDLGPAQSWLVVGLAFPCLRRRPVIAGLSAHDNLRIGRGPGRAGRCGTFPELKAAAQAGGLACLSRRGAARSSRWWRERSPAGLTCCWSTRCRWGSLPLIVERLMSAPA